ncbi:MAG: DUF4231 domain-containing protein [Peptostreptococcaceae bacterium]|nr:DUF4231 domain-containing protein [Peptostreptococcaceae bacterium]
MNIEIRILIFILLVIFIFISCKHIVVHRNLCISEKIYINKLINCIFHKPNDILKIELEHDMNWYLEKVHISKYLYSFVCVYTIIMNGIIPLLNIFELDKTIISIISISVSILVALNSFLRSEESWIRNRKTFEDIKYLLEEFGEENIDEETFMLKYKMIKKDNLNTWFSLRKGKSKNDNYNKNKKNK